MSYDDQTEARSRLELLADTVPIDRDLLLLLSGMNWGFGGALLGQRLGYTFPETFIPMLMGLSVLMMTFVLQVMDS
jgi:hypothetical protein